MEIIQTLGYRVPTNSSWHLAVLTKMRLLPKTANTFLRESSIHGFRYLVDSKTPLVKILWLLSVVFSVTMSMIIIYMNIVNWNSTPAVVTNMYPTLAKGTKVLSIIGSINENYIFYRQELHAHDHGVSEVRQPCQAVL